jgi:hypothetical protein
MMRLCTIDDITGEAPCRRLAQWVWELDDGHPVFLCNFHAEPFEPLERARPASWRSSTSAPHGRSWSSAEDNQPLKERAR